MVAGIGAAGVGLLIPKGSNPVVLVVGAGALLLLNGSKAAALLVCV